MCFSKRESNFTNSNSFQIIFDIAARSERDGDPFWILENAIFTGSNNRVSERAKYVASIDANARNTSSVLVLKAI